MAKTSLFLIAALLAWAPRPPAAMAAGAPPAPLERDFPDLTSGRYEVKVSGLLCTVCTRAIAAELGKLREVASVKTDLERETISLEIKSPGELKFKALRRALAKAERRAAMGTHYAVASIRYRP